MSERSFSLPCSLLVFIVSPLFLLLFILLFQLAVLFSSSSPSPMKKKPKNIAHTTMYSIYFSSLLQGVSWTDDDLFPVAVLQVLLGGGGSFSAGGPGKGMYSRLFTRVLNVYNWIESAMAANVSYSDSGVFFLQGSAPPKQIETLLVIFVHVLDGIVSNGVDDVELNRARNQLKSSLMMNLESKAVLMEDIGRQILAGGRRYSAAELCASIDAVTAEDLVRVTRNMLATPPSISAVGNIENLPSYQRLSEAFQPFRDAKQQA